MGLILVPISENYYEGEYLAQHKIGQDFKKLLTELTGW